MTYDLKFISLGAGVQSSALYLMSCNGDIEKADVAIFADTGDEPKYVYEYLEYLKDIGSIPIHTVQFGHLSEDAMSVSKGLKRRFATIPAFTKEGEQKTGMLMRQCTNDYKIQPIQKEIRKLLGYKKSQRIKKLAKAMIGISTDEVTRCKPSRIHWIENGYPLIDLEMSRANCYGYLEKHKYKIPNKSACVFCPFHDDSTWKQMKQDHPDDFKKAVEFDKGIRNMTKGGVKKPIFVHRSCKPLGEVNFGEDQLDLFDNECEGYCGV